MSSDSGYSTCLEGEISDVAIDIPPLPQPLPPLPPAPHIPTGSSIFSTFPPPNAPGRSIERIFGAVIENSSSGDMEGGQCARLEILPSPGRRRHRRKRKKRGSEPAGKVGGGSQEGAAVSEVACSRGSGETSCRICMEGVERADFRSGKALKLGCKCCDGLEVVHAACAQKWFKIRKNTQCEICGEEAKGLPKAIKHEVRELARARREQTMAGTNRRLQLNFNSLRRTQSEELHLCTYTTFCLLPAALSAIFMVFFYHESLEVDVVPTMIFAITVSSATMLHWLIEPNRPVWHIVFVVLFLGFIMGLSFILVKLQQWAGLVSCISGAIVGTLLSVGVYALIRLIAAMLIQPVIQRLRNRRTARQNSTTVVSEYTLSTTTNNTNTSRSLPSVGWPTAA